MENILKIEISCINDTYFSSGNISDFELAVSFDSFMGQKELHYDHIFPTLAKDYEPKLNDKLYFAKYTSIPRVKLKNLTKDYKIKSTTNIDDANAIFISNKNISKYVDTQWFYTIETVKLKEFIADAKANNCIDDYYFEKVESALEFSTADYLLTDYHTRSLISRSSIPFYVSQGLSSSSERIAILEPSFTEVYKKIVSGTTLIYDEADLLKYINGADALPIEEEMFNSLCEMFDSSDKDNHTMAMEIMANSSFDDSLLYLCLLFNKYHTEMQNSRTRTHVNFKSLLSLMEMHSSYYYIEIDGIAKRLKKHNKLTKENLDILLKYLGVDIIERGSSSFFKVKTITLSDEYLSTLNMNYTYSVIDDYTPSPVEEEPVDITLEEEAVTAVIEEVVETEEPVLEETVEEPVVVVDKELIDFDNVIIESKTNNDEYFL